MGCGTFRNRMHVENVIQIWSHLNEVSPPETNCKSIAKWSELLQLCTDNEGGHFEYWRIQIIF